MQLMLHSLQECWLLLFAFLLPRRCIQSQLVEKMVNEKLVSTLHLLRNCIHYSEINLMNLIMASRVKRYSIRRVIAAHRLSGLWKIDDSLDLLINTTKEYLFSRWHFRSLMTKSSSIRVVSNVPWRSSYLGLKNASRARIIALGHSVTSVTCSGTE